MKLAIVGSRDYPDLERIRRYVRTLPLGTIVISGNAKGVDRTAENEARQCGLEVISIPAQWDKYGKSAGFRRNIEIVEQVECVVAFTNGSKGTAHTINEACKRGLQVICNPRDTMTQP